MGIHFRPSMPEEHVGIQLQTVDKNSSASLEKKSEALDRAAVKKNVSIELQRSDHPSFIGKSEAVWKEIIKNKPSIGEKITQFQALHSEKLAVLEKKSWNQLKGQLSTKMTEPFHSDNLSYEEFRHESNLFIQDILNEALKEQELPTVRWSACGTAGYNSDVDTVLTAESGKISTAEAVSICRLRETAHAFIFNGLSGTQLDTESYIAHGAELNTHSQLSSQQNLSQFTTSEIGMAILQSKLGLRDSPEEWKEFCHYEVTHALPSNREAVTEVIDQVHSWQNELNADILKQIVYEHSLASCPTVDDAAVAAAKDKLDEMGMGEIEEQAQAIMQGDGEAFKRAAANYKTPILIKLANKCDEIEKELKASDPKSADHGKLTIQFDILYKMITSNQDEGTFSQAEGHVTLFKEEGQIDQRNKEKLPKIMKAKAAVLDDLNSRINNQILQSHLEHMRLQITARVPEKAAPTIQELTLASYEECQQFKHVIHSGLHSSPELSQEQSNSKAGKTAISAGKYCYRTTSNLGRAMKLTEEEAKKNGKQLPSSFFTLKKEVISKEYAAEQLELSKRKFKLNQEAFTSQLGDSIATGQEKAGKNVDRFAINKNIKNMVVKFKNSKQPTQIKREKMNALVTNLEKLGYVESTGAARPSSALILGEKMAAADKDIHNILEAFVGYQRVKTQHSDLIPIFEKGDQILLKELKLETAEDVLQFADGVADLQKQWQNMAHELGLLPPLAESSWIKGAMNFHEIWQEAKYSNN